MTPPGAEAVPVSVVVVSEDRPALLCRCLAALRQLDYPAFEIVVVADAPGRAALAAAGLDAGVKVVAQGREGISAARNAGIAQAAGEVVAFLDDDAVPEPTWLAHLAAPFADAGVACTGGFVRGRNGISFQWRGRVVDRTGRATPIPDWGPAPRAIPPGADGCARTEGTNMAVRRDVLAALGGFDPGFRFYLDETDLNLRLAAAGHLTVLVPLAQVHHGFGPSRRRRADRTPTDLSENGESLARLLRRHAPDAADAALAAAEADERRRLLRLMVAGGCEPRDVGRLVATFRAGIARGRAAPLSPPPPLGPPAVPFARVEPVAGGDLVLAGRPWARRRLRAAAARASASGARVSLYLFGPTLRPHRVRYHPGGWWEQSGGVLGRSDRDSAVIRLRSFAHCLADEHRRTAAVRGCGGAARICTVKEGTTDLCRIDPDLTIISQ